LEHRIDHSLDIRTTIYPLALLKASHAFREMKSGETMEIVLGDVDAREYLFKVLPASLCELIEIREEETLCRILVKKRTQTR
jgi:TusA-related sulfurtransferase